MQKFPSAGIEATSVNKSPRKENVGLGVRNESSQPHIIDHNISKSSQAEYVNNNSIPKFDAKPSQASNIIEKLNNVSESLQNLSLKNNNISNLKDRKDQIFNETLSSPKSLGSSSSFNNNTVNNLGNIYQIPVSPITFIASNSMNRQTDGMKSDQDHQNMRNASGINNTQVRMNDGNILKQSNRTNERITSHSFVIPNGLAASSIGNSPKYIVATSPSEIYYHMKFMDSELLQKFIDEKVSKFYLKFEPFRDVVKDVIEGILRDYGNFVCEIRGSHKNQTDIDGDLDIVIKNEAPVPVTKNLRKTIVADIGKNLLKIFGDVTETSSKRANTFSMKNYFDVDVVFEKTTHTLTTYPILWENWNAHQRTVVRALKLLLRKQELKKRKGIFVRCDFT
ncbi:hypothetical protein HK096_001104 [Nowakowskiella sp. JEL0078]|nr:hypothetical protein HK096_001104 [Nowakowskiella sp. JEL0078]